MAAPGAAPQAASLIAQEAELCRKCHVPTEMMKSPTVVHPPAREGKCLACHAAHTSRQPHLVKRGGAELCVSCHTAIQADLTAPWAHAPVESGACTQCHQAHAGDNARLLAKKSPELCFDCHEGEKALLAEDSVHPPFADGDCATCHAPHGSGRPALLIADPKKLCLECHDPASADLRKAHPVPVANADCSSCHNPHASPQAKLVRSEPHQVFATCGRCHDTGGKLLAPPAELCLRCHADVQKAAALPDAHPGLANPRACLACHTPHTSDRPQLIRGASERDVCLTCHQEIQSRQETSLSVHPESGEAGACSACHLGHRSEQKSLLESAPAELCRSCHEDHSTFAHPMGAGVIDPRSGKELSCLSCHSPHGTQFPSLLTDSPQRSLCVQCHSDSGPVGSGHGATSDTPPNGR
jgi:predicted CXXCH cytochrome family protein